MQKSPLQYNNIIFQSKVIRLICQNVPIFIIRKCILYMEYTIPYMGNTGDFLPRDCREENKPSKTWRNEVDTKTVKITTSEIHINNGK